MEAETCYLDNAKRLAFYGVDLHEATVRNNLLGKMHRFVPCFEPQPKFTQYAVSMLNNLSLLHLKVNCQS
jgi:hypothetical protein